jgi:hypothetical protein
MRKLVVALLMIVAVACSPKRDQTGPDAASCSPGDPPRCVGPAYQECQDGEYVTEQTCPVACSVSLGGCVECDPSGGPACDGNTVVSCNPDGTLGGVIETCEAGEECMDGQCARACTADGVDLIYVVDQNYNFLSFDPRLISQGAGAFSLIGQLNCPAGAPYPSWPAATPFSMSVDRNGVAWVLYTSGEIFNVNIQNAQCTPTSFQRTQQGSWYLFGMGYSTDTAGGDTEKLYIAGGPEQPAPNPMTGYVDPASLLIQNLGAATTGENSPELTGTGDAALFGYFPGTISNGFVQEISKATGNVMGNPMPAGQVPGGPLAWAFAHWGGKFYIFVTDNGLPNNSMVQVVDRATGAYEGTPISNLPYFIVGAGVSTCAPVIIQ